MASKNRPKPTIDFIEIYNPDVLERLESIRLEQNLRTDEEVIALLTELYSLDRLDVILRRLNKMLSEGDFKPWIISHLRVMSSFLKTLQDKRII